MEKGNVVVGILDHRVLRRLVHLEICSVSKEIPVKIGLWLLAAVLITYWVS